MTESPRQPHQRVSISELSITRADVRGAEDGVRRSARDVAAGEVLRAQTRIRAGVASVVTAIQMVLLLALGSQGSVTGLLAALAVYLGFIAAIHAAVARWGSASPRLVTTSLCGDLAFAFVTTLAGSAHPHTERALFGAMLVVHVANFYYGRRQAWRAGAIGFVCYVALVLASSRGQLVDHAEELWSLALGFAGTALVIMQAASVRRRLRALVVLFERAEEGDFSQAYDEEADRRPDAITRVGHAYNRVRMQLANMVLTDPLTGCLNRRGFDHALAREVARSARGRWPVALLVIDLDHFKLVNDTHGHLAGDEVLRAVGALLCQAGRGGDIAARVGGEEFAVLLADTGEAGALHFATRLCDLVRAHRFAVSMLVEPIRLTTSIGVTSATPVAGGDCAARLTARADAALYAAKRGGRDQVRLWSPEVEQLTGVNQGVHATGAPVAHRT